VNALLKHRFQLAKELGHKEWVRVSEGGQYLLVKDVNLS